MATRSVNFVTLMGNLTRDPELRTTPNGKSVCAFSMALNSSYKDLSGEWVESTDYIDLTAWGPLGENVAKYLQKGRRCFVTGRLSQRSWEQDGQKRSKVEVVASDVVFLDSKGDGGGGSSSDGGGEYDQTSVGGSSSSSRGSSAGAKKKDTVIEDIGDEPINLDDIPF